MITPYTLTTVLGVCAAVFVWAVLRRSGQADSLSMPPRRLALLLVLGAGGAGLGAKLAFLLAEGWAHRDDPTALLTGKSITGALLGGYVGIELGKRVVGHKAYTGDYFAIAVPVGIAIGRLGCCLEGCCPGVMLGSSRWWAWTDATGQPRWPSQPAEFAFNVAFVVWAVLANRTGSYAGNRFHIYLLAYGTFRFLHEFARDNPAFAGPIGGYHLIALATAGTGALALRKRLGKQRATSAGSLLLDPVRQPPRERP